VCVYIYIIKRDLKKLKDTLNKNFKINFNSFNPLAFILVQEKFYFETLAAALSLSLSLPLSL
jgi:hypothetical protein